MKVKKLFKSYRKNTKIPNLKEDIKYALGIHSKRTKAFVLSRYKLQFSVMSAIVLLGVILFNQVEITSDPNTSGPVVNNDTNNSNNGGGTIRLLSRTIEEMTNESYTLTIFIQDQAVYAFKIEETRIEILYFFDGTDETLTYFVDLKNETFPNFYSNYDGANWIKTVEDISILEQGYLFPMRWLDPSIIEDDWFEFDETKQTYILKEAFKERAFENSSFPLLNFEDVHITMKDDNLSILVKGMEDHNEDVSSQYLVVYSNIGKTNVNLPTNILATSDNMVEAVLNIFDTYENNYSFTYILTNENTLDESYYYGSRYNDTWLKIDAYTSDTTYLSKIENTFKQVLYSNNTYKTSELTEGSYEEAIKSFSVIQTSSITKDWVDENTIANRLYVGASNRIFDAYYDNFIQINLGNNVNIRDIYIGFVRSLFSGTSLNISISLDINLIPYTLTYSIYGFNQVLELDEPKPIEYISLDAIIQLAANSSQYVLNQYLSDENQRYLVTNLYKDKLTYIVTESLNGSTNQIKMYGFEDNNYQVIDVLDNNTLVKSVIDEQTYMSEIEKAIWLDLSKLLNVLIVYNSSYLSYLEFTEEDYLNMASKTIIETYNFISGQVEIINRNRYGSEYILFVKLTLLSKETNEEVILELEYSDIGEVNLVFGH
jgi:hypothetical protein